jgi:hypothetical protein
VAPALEFVAWYRISRRGPAAPPTTASMSVMTNMRGMTTRNVVMAPKTTAMVMQRGASRRGFGISSTMCATASTGSAASRGDAQHVMVNVGCTMPVMKSTKSFQSEVWVSPPAGDSR